MSALSSDVQPTPLSFLGIPLEIRLRIYAILFRYSRPIYVAPAPPTTTYEEDESHPDNTTYSADRDPSYSITPFPLSSHILRINKQTQAEALPYLYTIDRIFDLTHREAIKLLLHNIGAKNFSYIHHIVLDWDPLQDFAWCLKKTDYQEAMAGLRCVEINLWRMRHLVGTSTHWRNVKGYERQLCQAALEVTEKHPKLKLLAETVKGNGNVSASVGNSLTEGIVGEGANRGAKSNSRVKWRFVESIQDLRPNETVLDIKADLVLLQPTKEEANEIGFEHRMMDPF